MCLVDVLVGVSEAMSGLYSYAGKYVGTQAVEGGLLTEWLALDTPNPCVEALSLLTL